MNWPIIMLTYFPTFSPTGMGEHGKKRVWSAKASLRDVGRDYARNRTKEADIFITEYSLKQKENKTDLLYFLLTEDLRYSNDHRLKEVSNVNVFICECMKKKLNSIY